MTVWDTDFKSDLQISGPFLSGFFYSFGPYTLADSGRALRRNGVTVAATPKVRAILLALVEADGQAISKEDLLRMVWPDSFVEEGNLTQSISVLRKLLARDYPDESPIETISKFGYRFSAPVEIVPETTGENEAQEGVGSEVSGGGVEGSEALYTMPAAELFGIASSLADSDGEAGVAVQPVRVAERLGWTWLMWFAAAALLLVTVGWVYASHRVSDRAKLEFVPFTTNADEDRVTAAAISPDGHLVAYADADGVVLRAEDAVVTRTLRMPLVRDVERLAWSPDGLQLLVSGTGTDGIQRLWTLSKAGDQLVMLREHARLGAISPDGLQVAYGTDGNAEVWVMGRDGANAHLLLAGSPSVSYPVMLWSADGKHLLLERRTVFQSDGKSHSPRTEDEIEGFHAVYVAIDVATGGVTATADNVRMGDACLLGADRLLFSRSEETEYGESSSFWEVGLDEATGGFVLAPVRVRDFGKMHVLSLNSSLRTGVVVAVFKHGRPGIYVGSLHLAEGTLDQVRLLTVNEGQAGPHSWTKDGSAILFESNHGDHRYHIYKQELTRHEPESLTASMGGEAYPRVTPDGRDVLFQTKGKDQGVSIWRVAFDGGPPALVHQADQPEEYRCPLTGSTCVLGTTIDFQRVAFWVLDPMHGKGPQLFAMPASWKAHGDWDVSPDGSEVVVVSRVSPQPELRVIELATGKTQELLIPIESPVIAVNWVPNGNGWIVASSTGLGNELLYVDRKGTPKLLRETTNSTWGIPSRDGTKLAFADEIVDSNVWLLAAAR